MKYYHIIILAVLLIVTVMVNNKCNSGMHGQNADTTTTTTQHYEAVEPSSDSTTAPTLVAEQKPVLPKRQEYYGTAGIAGSHTCNCDSLMDVIEALQTELYTMRSYRDTAHTDSNGYVVCHSEVDSNRLIKQKIDFHLQQKVINTIRDITAYAPPTRQLYFNYGVGVSYQSTIPVLTNWAANATVGFTYKDRKDRQYTINGSANTWQQYQLDFIRGGKISLKRKR